MKLSEPMSVAAEEVLFTSPANFLIIARRVFEPERLRALRTAIDAAVAANRDEDDRARRARAVGVAPDAVRLNREWYEIWREARTELFLRRVPAFTQMIFPPQIRTVRNAASLVPWHQDSAYMRHLGAKGHRQVITCNVPLEETNKGKPSLEFAVIPGQGPVEHLVREEAAINQFDLSEERRPDPRSVRRFELRLGDVFVFGQDVLHRTYNDGPPDAERTSMEFRATTRDGVIAGKDYYDLEKGTWYVA
jgi:hypothetical protein